MKIGIIAAGWAFMPELLAELKKHHEVIIFKTPINRKILKKYVKASKIDVLYCEFCSGYAIPITQIPKKYKIVVRLHRGEVHGGWMRKVDFRKIDLLILVNKFMKGYAFKYHPRLKKVKAIKVIQLGVDTDKFSYNPGRGYGKRIGWVGWVKDVKQPFMIINLMRQLPDWQLKFLAIPSVYKNLIKQVARRVKQRNIIWIKEKIPHKKMPRYYRKIDILVNTSVIESQCVSVLEAMSSGVYSLIRKWPHPECKPEEIYPRKNLFDNMTECKRKILAWVKLSVKEKKSKSWQARQFIQKHHNAKIQTRKMRKAIESA